jgi:hypothetical protein
LEKFRVAFVKFGGINKLNQRGLIAKLPKQ